MKLPFIALMLFFPLHSPEVAHEVTASPQSTAETKGSCSPIAPDNRGTINITCSGFSEKQNKIIANFLQQLSSNQSKDQDVLLAKLNELLELTRSLERQSSRRIIPTEAMMGARSGFVWATCETTIAEVIVPHDDEEAAHLANQLADILRSGGVPSRVDFGNFPESKHDPDIRTVTDIGGMCAVNGLLAAIGRTLVVQTDLIKGEGESGRSQPTDNGANPVPTHLQIYVYPKSKER
jgi:hypothetical protein